MKYREIIERMTSEEKASLMSGKDYWKSNDIERLGINSMFLADGSYGIRKQKKHQIKLDLIQGIRLHVSRLQQLYQIAGMKI